MAIGFRSERFSSRSLRSVLLAILLVQTLYWLVINPVLFVPKPTPDKLRIYGAKVAVLPAPDYAALRSARFETVELPWEGCCEHGYRALRVNFDLDKVPPEGLGFVHGVESDNFKVYLNGELYFADGEMTLPDISYHGSARMTLRLQPSLLVRGRNTIEYIMVRDPGIPFFSSNGPTIGNYAKIKQAYSYRNFSLNSYLAISQGIGLAAALLAFILWLRSSRNPAILWMALLCTAWALRIVYHRQTYPLLQSEVRIVFLFVCVNLLPLALLNFANEWTGHASRWLRRISITATALCIATVAVIVGFGLFQKIDTADRISMALALVYSIVTAVLFVIHYARRPETRHLEAAVFILCAVLIAADAASPLFDLPYGDHVKRALPILLLGFLAPFFANNVRLFRSMSEFNTLLQNQLSERTVELEFAHAREKELVRVQAHQSERHRIMQDMHDGLGSQLMSMLLAARRGQAKPEAVAEGLQVVIDEMRLLIDSMDSVGESLGSAFAIFRERIGPRVGEAGMAFHWNAEFVGPLPEYGPRQTLQIFRIMQEAVTNALKHSGGDDLTVTVAASPEPGYDLRISIADNGKGMGTVNPRGKGLASMAARADSLGGTLRTRSDTDGVWVELDLLAASVHVP